MCTPQGGEPDLKTAARMILNDWIRGRLPYFEAPPFDDGSTVPHGKKVGAVRRFTFASNHFWNGSGRLLFLAPTRHNPTSLQNTLGVEQLFKKIAVKTKFEADDAKPPAGHGPSRIHALNAHQHINDLNSHQHTHALRARAHTHTHTHTHT